MRKGCTGRGTTLTVTNRVEETGEHDWETDTSSGARSSDKPHCKGPFTLEVLTYDRESRIRAKTY